MNRIVLICCHQTCPKQGSNLILEAFQKQAPVDVAVIQSGCFGECGSGPMVLVLPEEIWYSQVQVRDVATIVNQHLIGDRPVQHKLYRKFHPTNDGLIWFISCCTVGGLLALFLWFLASQTSYI